MASLPGLTFTIRDGALGIVQPSAANNSVTLGVCSAGTPNTLYGFQDINTLINTCGYGPAVEAVALKLAIGGGVQYLMPVTPLYNGAAGSVTFVGAGAARVSVSFAPAQQIVVTCSTGGAFQTAQFTFALGTGNAGAPVTSGASPWVYPVPGTLTQLTFTSAGGTPNFTAGDTWTISTTSTGTATAGGGNVTTSTVTQSSSPFDNYVVHVYIVATGSPGTGTFKYSTDGGNSAVDGVSTSSTGSYSSTTTIPSGLKYSIPNTGLVLTWTNASSTAGDVSYFNTVASGYDATTPLSTTFTTLYANNTTWGFVHLVGLAATVNGAETIAAALDSQMTTAQNAFRYAFAMMGTPTQDGTGLGGAQGGSTGGSIVNNSGALVVGGSGTTPSTAGNFGDGAYTAGTSTWPTFSSARVAVGAGDYLGPSPVSGKMFRRSADFIAAARACLVPASENLHYVGRGSLGGFVNVLFRDESKTVALDTDGFITLGSMLGITGYYIIRGQTLALSTSDYKRLSNRRVMDLACAVARSALLPYVGATVIVNSNTAIVHTPTQPGDFGTIVEYWAQRIENEVNQKLYAAVVTPGYASASVVALSRTQNILSTSTEPVTISVTPLGSMDTITVSIGFASSSVPTH